LVLRASVLCFGMPARACDGTLQASGVHACGRLEKSFCPSQDAGIGDSPQPRFPRVARWSRRSHLPCCLEGLSPGTDAARDASQRMADPRPCTACGLTQTVSDGKSIGVSMLSILRQGSSALEAGSPWVYVLSPTGVEHVLSRRRLPSRSSIG
jgi:hypothetical protein